MAFGCSYFVFYLHSQTIIVGKGEPSVPPVSCHQCRNIQWPINSPFFTFRQTQEILDTPTKKRDDEMLYRVDDSINYSSTFCLSVSIYGSLIAACIRRTWNNRHAMYKGHQLLASMNVYRTNDGHNLFRDKLLQ